jgi:hypothetical protein
MTLDITLQSELNELFSDSNTSFYYLRFCFSMKCLAEDEDILEKVPYLLTNKLPLFEFMKNEMRFEYDENNAAQRVQTAAQINPWKQDEKNMETN